MVGKLSTFTLVIKLKTYSLFSFEFHRIKRRINDYKLKQSEIT